MTEKNIEKLAEVGEKLLIEKMEFIIDDLSGIEVSRMFACRRLGINLRLGPEENYLLSEYEKYREIAESCNINVKKYNLEINKIKKEYKLK